MSRLPRLHAVTDDLTLARDGWRQQAVDVLEAGGESVAVHVRGRRTAGVVLFDHTMWLVGRAVTSGGWVVVNDRVDIALAAGAHAVHLGARSLDVLTAKRILGERARVGVSLHAGDAPAGSRVGGADYAFVGNIFETPTHAGVKGMGAAGLAGFVERALELPLLGIGGIGPENARAVMASGAYGVAVVRAVWDRSSPADAAVELLRMIEEAIDA